MKKSKFPSFSLALRDRGPAVCRRRGEGHPEGRPLQLLRRQGRPHKEGLGREGRSRQEEELNPDRAGKVKD